MSQCQLVPNLYIWTFSKICHRATKTWQIKATLFNVTPNNSYTHYLQGGDVHINCRNTWSFYIGSSINDVTQFWTFLTSSLPVVKLVTFKTLILLSQIPCPFSLKTWRRLWTTPVKKELKKLVKIKQGIVCIFLGILKSDIRSFLTRKSAFFLI